MIHRQKIINCCFFSLLLSICLPALLVSKHTSLSIIEGFKEGRYLGEEEYQSDFTEKFDEITSQEVLHEHLKGILITSEEWAPREYALRGLEGVKFYRAPEFLTLRGQSKLAKNLSREFLHRPFTYSMLERMKERVRAFYKKQVGAFVMVSMPMQNVKKGVLTLSAFPARLGKVTVKGNQWFDSHRFENYLRVRENEILDSRIVQQDLSSMNVNPFHRVDAVYKEGGRYGSANLELYVQDERPLKVQAGSNNSGYSSTSLYRSFAKASWGNVLGFDHMISFSYEIAPNIHRFQEYAVDYKAPMSQLGDLTAHGEYTKSSKRNIQEEGESVQAFVRYAKSFGFGANFCQETSISGNYKTLNNDLNVGGEIVCPNFATLASLKGGYFLSYRLHRNHTLTTSIKAVLQPFGLGMEMTQSRYALFSPGANPSYFYTKMKTTYAYHGEHLGIAFLAKIRAQIASGALFPTERFGLGGVDTIRGYRNRYFNADDAIVGNFELKFHTTKLMQNFFNRIEKELGQFDVAAFFDIGAGRVFSSEQTEKALVLAGAGPSFFYQFGPWLKARLDLGIRLMGEEGNGATLTSILPMEAKVNSLPKSQIYFSVGGAF